MLYDELSVFKQIKDAFPKLSQAECETAVLLLKEFANNQNITFDEYVQKNYPNGIAERDELVNEYRGAVKFLGSDAAAIIKAGVNADFSTFVHETVHVFRRQLTGDLKTKAERAFNVLDSKWTAEQEEAFALGAEQFFRTRIERDADKKEVWTKCGEYVRGVYGGLGDIIEITPEMEAVYEEMFFAKNPIVEDTQNEIEAVNKKFNDELDLYINGELPKNHIFKLGLPGDILQTTGFPLNEIELSAARLNFKANIDWHPYSLSEVKNLAAALQEPVAVFSYGDKTKSQNVIIDLQKDDKNFLVGVHFNQTRHGAEISDIRTLFNKDNAEWLNWINENKHLYLNIEKLQVLVDQQRINVAEVEYLNLEPINRLLQENKNVKHYFPNLQSEPQILYQSNIDQMMFDFGGDENERHSEKSRRKIGTRAQRLRLVKDDYAAGKIDFDTAVEKYISIYPKLPKETAEKIVKNVFGAPINVAAVAEKIMEYDFDTLDKFVNKDIDRFHFRSDLVKNGYSVAEITAAEQFAETLKPTAEIKIKPSKTTADKIAKYQKRIAELQAAFPVSKEAIFEQIDLYKQINEETKLELLKHFKHIELRNKKDNKIIEQTAENESKIEQTDELSKAVSNEELTTENFAVRFIEKTKEPQFAKDKIEAARELLRETTSKNRKSILDDLKAKGCVDAESTQVYLRSLLPNEEKQNKNILDIKKDSALGNVPKENTFSDPQDDWTDVGKVIYVNESAPNVSTLGDQFLKGQEEFKNLNADQSAALVSAYERAYSKDYCDACYDDNDLDDEPEAEPVVVQKVVTEERLDAEAELPQDILESQNEMEVINEGNIFEEDFTSGTGYSEFDFGEQIEQNNYDADFSDFLFQAEQENDISDYTLDDIENEFDNMAASLDADTEENIIPLFEEFAKNNNNVGNVELDTSLTELDTGGNKQEGERVTGKIIGSNGKEYRFADDEHYENIRNGIEKPVSMADYKILIKHLKPTPQEFENIVKDFDGSYRELIGDFYVGNTGGNDEKYYNSLLKKVNELYEKRDAVKNNLSETEQNTIGNNTFKPFGAWSDFNSRLSTTERKAANNAAIEVLSHTFEGVLPTEQDRAVLSRYSGFGGIDATDERGVLYDYYTSPPVADMTWKLLNKIAPLNESENVLEPSCGTGVFFESAPSGVKLTGVELDERTAAVANVLHESKAHIINQSFEQFNITNNTKYDRVIGNAPFGVRPPDTAALDMPNIKSLDNYFVTRCIDNLKADGTMALIVAPGVLENKSNADFRLSLCKKAQFAGAVKLSNKSFNHTHTQVEPDILLFRKYPSDIIRRIDGMSGEEFKDSDLYNDFFVSGNYFNAYPQHLMGWKSEGSGQWGRDEVKGDVTQEGIEKIISSFLPFEKIDYEAIRKEFAESEETKNKNKYLYLTKEESVRVANGSLTQGTIKVESGNAYLLDDQNVWKNVSNGETLCDKLKRLTTISGQVNLIRADMQGGISDSKEQDIVKANLNSYLKAYKTYPSEDRDIKRFLKDNPSVKGIYEALITPSAEILTSKNIYSNNAEIIYGHNPAIEALIKLQEMNLTATVENIALNYPLNAESLIREMWNNPDVFIESETADMEFILRENFIAGDAWEKIDALQAQAEQTNDEQIKAKLLYGASELQRAVGWSAIEEVEFSPHSSWIPQDIVKDWVNSEDGLGRSFSNLAKNKDGKWGRLLDHDKVDSEFDANYNRIKTVTPAGTWIPESDEIIYYLNSRKQRSKNIDTKVYNEDMDESFKTFIANNREYRNSLEQIYNRTFKTTISAPVKTYSINIDGWMDAESGGKTLKPHQWQTIHHLYRQGSGISALGVGFGKTRCGIGLMSVLRQEGQVKRAWLQVPNNKVKDWVEEIKAVMPGLKIASIDPEESGYSNQAKRYAKYQLMASSSADIIIMPESAASEIQLSADNNKIIQNEIAHHFAAEKKTKRQQEEAKIRGLDQTQNGKTNKTVCFEDFGCDALFVDEAHNYKNLFPSSLARETGINDGRRSERAMSLFKKSQYILNNHNDKNVFLFTATPLTNSPLEYYNMLQYVAPKELERFGINTIDGFIREFAKIERGMIMDWKKELATEGNILTGFKNLDTLQKLFFKYTDFQNDPSAIGLEKPTALIHQNIIPKDETQLKVMKAIADELERYINMDSDERKIKFEGQNFLTFFGQFRTASLDLELYDPQTFKDWKNPKLQTLAKNTAELYKETKAGQVIFCDRVVSRDESFNMHEKIKAELVAQGFKESEIVIVNGITKSGSKKSDSSIEREVSSAIKDYNSGKYKVIIGTTGCIGEGVNLQKNSSGLHHVDIPFRPSDFIQRNGRIDRQGNEQDTVRLHTYMSAGTLDSHSVQRVQIKANWIDQLLKTKSNVFANPNDENAIDGQELLLALSEEWGDTEKAAGRRAEMERIKAEKISEAYNKQRIGYMKTLSTMRGALQTANLKTDSKEYKNRLDKIHNIETALKNNPTFNRHDLLETNELFLYNGALDEVFRKNDLVFVNDTVGIIQSLNPKKGEIISTRFNREGLSIQEVKMLGKERNWAQGKAQLLGHIEKASAVQIEAAKVITDERFYTDLDNETKKEFYLQHLEISYNSNRYRPVVFYMEDGKLEIVCGYGAYDSDRLDKIVNPFSKEGIDAIKTAVNNGLKYEKYMKEDILKEVFKTLHPLHDAIADGIGKAESEGSAKHGDEVYETDDEEQRAGSILRGGGNAKNIIGGNKDDVTFKKTVFYDGRGADAIRTNNILDNMESKIMDDDELLEKEKNAKINKYLNMGGQRWHDNDNRGEDRIYFNDIRANEERGTPAVRAKSILYALNTFGTVDIPPTVKEAYKKKYNLTYLPAFPAEAKQNGRTIPTEQAFEMLCSKPYYDVNTGKFVGEIFNALTSQIGKHGAKGSDSRDGHDQKYEISDALKAAFAVFPFQFSSVLQFMRTMQGEQKRNNISSLLKIERLPSDTQIKTLLDGIDPKYISPI